MNKKTLFLFLTGLFLLAQGCRKCYECELKVYYLSCHKGGDTILYQGGGIFLESALRNLDSLGFTCDTLKTGFEFGGGTSGKVCNKADIIRYEQLGAKCTKLD